MEVEVEVEDMDMVREVDLTAVVMVDRLKDFSLLFGQI